jgi:signal transduction histidine kinase/CheY-like chemotaxis protein
MTRVSQFCRGLRGKFILLIAGLLITSSMALGWLFLVHEVREESEKLEDKGRILARNLADSAELGVYTRDPALLAGPARRALGDADAVVVAVLDRAGLPLFSEARPASDVPPLSRLLQGGVAATADPDGSFRIFRDASRHQEIYLLLVPVQTRPGLSVGEEITFLPDEKRRNDAPRERIGTVLVGMSTDSMRASVVRLERALGLATLAVIIVGIILTILLVRIIADPVKQLVDATSRIAEGDLDLLLNLDTRDEIGELAQSFNQMTLKLRKSREELELTNAQLEQKVQERTRALEEAQSQLVQAEKMSVVGQLVSGVAHELNNPLAAVLGYSQLLLRMPMGEELRRGLQKIEAEADRSKRIVQNLLIFARKNKPQKRSCDLNDVVESVLELREYQFRVDNVRVVKDLSRAIPQTMADAGQLQQMVMNIVHNAQQAMVGTGREAVLTVRTSHRSGVLHLEIGDNGAGIAPEVLNRIFDPFFTTKEVGQGTGLGLSICYGIVGEHRGRIWADSRSGEGTVFHVEIPVERDPAETVAAPRGRSDHEAPAAQASAKARILIVDDESSIVDVLYDVLKLDGHDIETALNGRLALKKLEQKPFDVVISDLRMPGMSGQDLYEKLREMHSEVSNRIIFTTGDLASEETQGFLRRAGSPCLQKPFDLNEVRRLVQQVLACYPSGRGEIPWITPGEPPARDPAA